MPINALRFEGAAPMAQKITASSFTKSQYKKETPLIKNGPSVIKGLSEEDRNA